MHRSFFHINYFFSIIFFIEHILCDESFAREFFEMIIMFSESTTFWLIAATVAAAAVTKGFRDTHLHNTVSVWPEWRHMIEGHGQQLQQLQQRKRAPLQVLTRAQF